MGTVGRGKLAFKSVLYYAFGIGILQTFHAVSSLKCGVKMSDSDDNANHTSADFLSNCINGDCVSGICVCHKGWHGPTCQDYLGKVKYGSNMSDFVTFPAWFYELAWSDAYNINANFLKRKKAHLIFSNDL